VAAVRCSSCGRINSDLREICVSCGTPLPASGGGTTARKKAAARKPAPRKAAPAKPVSRKPAPAKPAPRKPPPPSRPQPAVDLEPLGRAGLEPDDELDLEPDDVFDRVPTAEIAAEAKPGATIPAPLALPPPPRSEPPTGPGAWVWIRRTVLILEGLLAIGSAAAAVWYERFDYLWVALAAGALPLLYSLLGVFRSRGWGRALRLATALVLAVVLAGSSFLVMRSCSQAVGPRANLAGCDFSQVVLVAHDLHGADLSGADLSGADLSRANLSGADLSEADLRDASLVSADLREADLSGADLRGVRLNSVRLEGADLSGANLTGLDISGQSFADVDLTEADLTGANLAKTDLTGSVLDRARLDGARIVGAGLATASLRGAVLRDATIRASNFNQASMDGVVLEGATLERVAMIGTTGLPDGRLAAALGVPSAGLGRALATHQIRLEAPAQIARALGAACAGAPVPEAGGNGQGGFHSLFVATDAGRPIAMAEQAAGRGWAPMAVRFGELVACVAPEEPITVEVCEYVDEESGELVTPTRRLRFTRHVRVVQARDGAVLLDRVYEGSSPESCPDRKPIFAGPEEDVIEGSHIGFTTLEPDLRALVYP
jgi:uncharacterized protein YjbI with pentapeptide repeats